MEIDDPILREIREGRTRNAEENPDTATMLRNLKKRQQQRGVKTVRFPPKRIKKQTEPEPAETSR